MPAKKIIFAIALCSIPLVFTSGIANAQDLNINTGNVQMSLGQNGVFIKTAPVFPVYPNSNFNNNRRIQTYRTNKVLKCRNVRQNRRYFRAGSQAIASSSTTVCN
ncbi:hypothetical protein [Calothrix sp. UHCC 0171]|uniref:hypothetical protein n=1 Tax=Calothrix sp. UHCC 0171 TaxID=3110245 RepID=UPI002B20E4DF|nr:hypothetical protein [Calothrix sp. UHCC 0171]MEA5572518.1 hypothetical protein [Calothrix sp. UHCC 0171]